MLKKHLNAFLFFHLILPIMPVDCQYNPADENGENVPTSNNFTFAEQYDGVNSSDKTPSHDYALNPQSAIKLAVVEQTIYAQVSVLDMNDKRPEKDDCRRSTQKYLAEYEHDDPAIGQASEYARGKIIAENPLLLFRMIRRIVTILKAEVLKQCSDKEENMEMAEAIKNGFHRMELPLPKDEDLNEAQNGLLRIQYVYGLNASQLRLGILQGVPTNATLTAGDCIDMFWWVMQKAMFTLAYQWLAAANLTFTENPGKENATEIKNLLDLSWNHFLRFAVYKSVADAEKMLRGKIQDRPKISGSEWLFYMNYATCRGESLLTEDMKKDLRCYLLGKELSPYWIIQPVRSERLYRDPPVWMFHYFVGDKTIGYIEKKAFDLSYERSGVLNSDKYSDHRTSVQTWIKDDDLSDTDQEMKTFVKQIEQLLRLNVYKRGASQSLQVVQYSSLGGHYNFHVDSVGLSGVSSGIPLLGDGDRLFTFYLFLNDVELGGYTAFHTLGIFVKPEKGSAILWRNSRLDGSPDHRTVHAGCPVIKGRKLGCNKWIMQDENMFKYKCPRSLKEHKDEGLVALSDIA